MDYKNQEFQDFLNEHKALSQSELEGLNFPRKKFKKPRIPGVYTGKLVAKEWGRNMSLISYFELGEDLIDLVKVTTYRNTQGNYMPVQGGINMVNAEVGRTYTLFLKETRNKSFLFRILSGDVNKNLLETLLKLYGEK